MKQYDEKKCLEFDVSEDPFMEADDEILEDEIAAAGVVDVCIECGGVIRPEERIRTMTTLKGEETYVFRWCLKCCAKMADGAYESRDWQ